MLTIFNSLLQTQTCSVIQSSLHLFRAWNSPADEFKQASFVAVFKNLLNSDIKRPPKYHSVGIRIGQILYARLRLVCSSLNSHLYHKNIVDSPSCLCGGFESASTSCLFVRDIQQRKVHTYQTIFKMIQHGICFLDVTIKIDRQNEEIFLKIKEFIVNSGLSINLS